MTQAPISDDIALRIALAARTLPDTSAASLIRVLEDAIGLPPTAKKLEKLQVRDLRKAIGGDFADLDDAALQTAVTILKGEANAVAQSAAVQPYEDGDMPESIRVACASNGGELLDGHFGSAGCFLIYQVSSSQNRLIEIRIPDDVLAGDKNADRARLIADCQVLYVASIGGPAAAKVVKTGIHPIKDATGGCARERVRALQETLGEKPPPWLAKRMGRTPEERVRFEREESDA